MKRICVVFVLMVGIAYGSNGQDTTAVEEQQFPTVLYDQERDRINSRDLPEAVKRALDGQEYRGWLINAAYVTAGMDFMYHDSHVDTMGVSDRSFGTGRDIFVVELKNGAQTKTVRFTEDGEKIGDDGQ